MGSIGAKLGVAFLIVGLTGAALVALVGVGTTAREFGEFVFRQDRATLVDRFEEHYQAHGSWVGVGETLPFRGLSGPMGPRGMHGMGPELGLMAIADDTGRVVLAGLGYRIGDEVPGTVLAASVPLLVDGQEVGRLLVTRGGFGVGPSGSEFLNRTTTVLLGGALGAAAVALLLGVFFTRMVSRPLREMTAATQAVAGGDLGRQVPVRSSDELGQLAQAFNQMSSELSRARELRRQMTADIAHELRTPLSVIIGHADAVQDGAIPASLESFQVINEEASRLERLVDDLGTLSRAEAGELSLSRRLISPRALLDRAVASHSPSASEKDIKLKVRPGPELPEVNVDPDRMAQVLGNLLDNALRFTPAGGSILLCAAAASGGVEVRVQDSGSGISPEELPRLFDRFYRGDKSRSRDDGGSGLGLAIAKSIVDGHGGDMRAESELGKGTTIIIELPVAS